MKKIRIILFLALVALGIRTESATGHVHDEHINLLPVSNTDQVQISVTNERGKPVGNASVSLELREVGILGYSSTHIAFRHTANGVYQSRNPVPPGSTFEIHLSIDAPGYQSYHRVLTQSGPVLSNYSAQLSTAAVDEEDEPVLERHQEPNGLSNENRFSIDPAPEPSGLTPLVHRIVSSSHYQGYRFQDPFKIADNRFSIDQEKNEIHFLLEEAGPTQSRTKELYLSIEGLQDYKIELQRDRQSRKETILQTAIMPKPSNRIHLPLPAASEPITIEAHYLGRNTWRGESFITITYTGEVQQHVFLTLIAKNPDEFSRIIDDAGRMIFDAKTKAITIKHLLGESVLNHMSFVNYSIEMPPERDFTDEVADEQPEYEIESPPTVGDWPRDNETEIVEVTSATGRVWMDRNLGASRAARSSTDTQAYGDLYQWGRPADGHQRRNSPTTRSLSRSDQPGHANFILSNRDANWDWRNPQNDNLWQGVNGVNNPCPPGYRLPTEAEWDAERRSWRSNNTSGAFGSPLKLPLAGYRSRFNPGPLDFVGSLGSYWSSSVSGSLARSLRFSSSNAYLFSYDRTGGASVRCLKDERPL